MFQDINQFDNRMTHERLKMLLLFEHLHRPENFEDPFDPDQSIVVVWLQLASVSEVIVRSEFVGNHLHEFEREYVVELFLVPFDKSRVH